MTDREEDRLEHARAVEADTPGTAARAGEGQVLLDESSSTEQVPAGQTEGPDEAEHDYLADLQRLQADFENFKKRTSRQQTEALSRASEALIKRLLPVLDHFQLAEEHGEAGGGIQLAIKELVEVLRAEGLEPIEAEGQPFDPTIHEAVETHDDPGVTVETVASVHRRGYRLNGHLLRAPYVSVARPQKDEGP